ncbi:NAD(P)H-binding protein [Actomonas aquatica]|uniref:NAD(P)H-binding protein n=1 Tax=Actomonas aquatica TaxID=2866162 RepID=A0ABZ1C4S1_9BACT|nr:NAD(P)H-binding protein [Opitutus sp. WL0086]WRQ86726.1 NAD(P)H-binding protein [Opitutus sp. WL0086]
MQNQSHSSTSSAPILVLGSSGKTGRRVAERLHAAGRLVREGSRAAAVPFDWNDSSNWADVLAGVEAVYIAYAPDLAAPGADTAMRELVRLASAAHVQRLVLLSGRGEPEAQLCEQIVRDSGIAWTIVRCSWFAQNFTESFLADSVAQGLVALPAGEIGEPFVDADDIADVATAALLDSRHTGQLYELTGPRLLTFAEAVAEFGAATGRELTYQQIPHADFIAGMEDAGVPADYVHLLDYLFGTVLDGRNAWVADGVERALGRPARDFAEFARRAAGAVAATS